MNSSKTAPKVEPARHWINGEWIGSSTVANSVSRARGARGMEEFQEVKTQIRVVAPMQVDHPRTQTS